MLTTFLGIILTILVFSLIVFVHELGHFFTARMTGMKVDEFGMGLPPRVKTLYKDSKGTIWSLNALPIGGFVRIKGEDVFVKGGRDTDAFSSKPWWARSVVLLAGVTMNFILAYVLFVIVFMTGAHPLAPNTIINTQADSFFIPSFNKALASGFITQSGGLTLSSVSGSIAQAAGIGENEKVLALNGMKPPKDYARFSHEIAQSETVLLRVESRTGSIRELTLKPENGKIGVYVGYEELNIHRDWNMKYSFTDSLGMARKELVAMTTFTWDALSDMVQKLIFPRIPEERKQATDMVSGPIGIGKVFVGVIEYSIPFSTVLVLIALISFNLGFFNLLPLPALDGGRWFTTTIATFLTLILPSKKEWGQKLEKYIHGFGFLFLLALSVLVAMMDIGRIF